MRREWMSERLMKRDQWMSERLMRREWMSEGE